MKDVPVKSVSLRAGFKVSATVLILTNCPRKTSTFLGRKPIKTAERPVNNGGMVSPIESVTVQECDNMSTLLGALSQSQVLKSLIWDLAKVAVVVIGSTIFLRWLSPCDRFQ